MSSFEKLTERIRTEIPFEDILLFSLQLPELQRQETGIHFFETGRMKYGRKEYLALRQETRSLNKPCLIVTDLAHISLTNRLLWECENAVASVCIDSEDPYPVEAGVSRTDYLVWDYQAARAEEDDFAFMSGWSNSYNLEKFRDEEVQEYINDAVLKITPYIDGQSQLLEVGIGSGMIAFPLIPKCRRYDGCDFSKEVLAILQKRIDQAGFQNTELYQLSAHEIGRISRSYDCILMSSVTEYFSGYNYMREVVRQCIGKIDGSGNIFLLDVFDLDRLDDYKESVARYAEAHPEGKSKKDFSHELYFPRNYWETLRDSLPGIKVIEVTDKIGEIDNEINRYRYDVRIEVDHSCGLSECSYKKQFAMGQRDS